MSSSLRLCLLLVPTPRRRKLELQHVSCLLFASIDAMMGVHSLCRLLRFPATPCFAAASLLHQRVVPPPMVMPSLAPVVVVQVVVFLAFSLPDECVEICVCSKGMIFVFSPTGECSYSRSCAGSSRSRLVPQSRPDKLNSLGGLPPPPFLSKQSSVQRYGMSPWPRNQNWRHLQLHHQAAQQAVGRSLRSCMERKVDCPTLVNSWRCTR